MERGAGLSAGVNVLLKAVILCAVQVSLRLQPAWMVWKGELACLLGLLALLLLIIVGLASIPSISTSLNWAEWRLIQSRIGVLALFLAVAHLTAMEYELTYALEKGNLDWFRRRLPLVSVDEPWLPRGFSHLRQELSQLCDDIKRRLMARLRERMTPTPPSTLWQQVLHETTATCSQLPLAPLASCG